MATALAMAIKTIIKTAIKKPKVSKALAKYSARGLVRKAGIWGLYGTYKKVAKISGLSKARLFAIFTSSVIKKNLLRSLGPFNFILDIFKKRGGIKYALKQFGWQRMTPMAIKKLWYLKQNYDNVLGPNNPFMRQAKEELWKKLRTTNKGNTYKWKIEQIEQIMDTDQVPKRFKKKLLDDWLIFKVQSPESHNFNRTNYKWNPSTGELLCSIRSGGGARLLHHYTFNEPDIRKIKKMVTTTNYGRMIFWRIYH